MAGVVGCEENPVYARLCGDQQIGITDERALAVEDAVMRKRTEKAPRRGIGGHLSTASYALWLLTGFASCSRIGKTKRPTMTSSTLWPCNRKDRRCSKPSRNREQDLASTSGPVPGRRMGALQSVFCR